MRKVSLAARTAVESSGSDTIEILLIEIAHPDLDEPVLLSTDMTERLSVEPLLYGTRSFWNWTGPQPRAYRFMAMSAALPGEEEEITDTAQIILENLSSKIAQVLRSTTRRASVDMAVVLSSDPDRAEAEFLGLKLVSAQGSAAEITLTISREPIAAEPWPSGRMTKQRFPGLHR